MSQALSPISIAADVGDPNTEAWTLCRRGRDLMIRGRISEGYACLERAAVAAPDNPYIQVNPWTHRHYLPDHTREELYQGLCHWAQRFLPNSWTQQDHSNNRDPERSLRIGYLSADFRQHAVATTFEPILDGHDAAQSELYGYGNIAEVDSVTERLACKFNKYRSIHGRCLQDIVDQIRADQIDILVHLAGHTANNCLEIMAFKPAPVQVDMGGLSTTGMIQVDYRITDDCYDPPAVHRHHSERCIALPGGLTAFCPPPHGPTVSRLPALQHETFTFGACNKAIKISDTTLDLWCRVLTALPEAQLRLKFQHADEPDVQSYFRDQFALRGILPARLQFVGWLPRGDHLAFLNEVDLLLDTTPYNGGLTTLEGLWMGIPTLSLTGDTFVSRAGLSILSRVGLETFCADSPEVYIEKAVAFARQHTALAEIRQGLRTRMLASPLCDVGRLARQLSESYRHMWRCWCQTAKRRVWRMDNE